MSSSSKAARYSNRSLNQYANVDTDSVNEETDNDTTNEDALERSADDTASEVTHLEDSPLLWPKKVKRRNLLLFSLASFIVSIAQSIILPSIEEIGNDLGGNRRTTAATLTLPLIVLGLMNMMISPYSDAYGRRIFHLVGLAIFTGASIACGFSADIYQLIGFRVLQAFGASAPAIVGSGGVSDMFDITERGQALGLFLLGPLVGPVLGPIFGGLLGAVDFGDSWMTAWRLIFFVIAGSAGFLLLISIVALKETLVIDHTIKKPCVNPVAPLAYLKYFRIFLIIMSMAIGFAGFFSINISFPIILAEVYNQPTMTIGLCYLPFGVGLVFGAVIGGRSADRFRRRGGTAEHRLLPSLLFIPLNGIFILGQGWVFEDAVNIHLAVVLVMSFFMGFTFILPRPGINTYVIESLKIVEGKDLASSATGLIFGVMLPFAAVIAQLSTLAFEEIGYGIFLSIVGGVLALSAVPVAIFVIRDIRLYKRTRGNSKAHVDYDAIN